MSYAGLYLKHYSLGVGLWAYIVQSGKAIRADNQENRHCLLSQHHEVHVEAAVVGLTVVVKQENVQA